MILILILYALVAIGIFLALKRYARSVRYAVAISVFVALSAITIGLLWAVGDKPLPGSVTVQPSEASPGR